MATSRNEQPVIPTVFFDALADCDHFLPISLSYHEGIAKAKADEKYLGRKATIEAADVLVLKTEGSDRRALRSVSGSPGTASTG